jgi:hypothetical protein
MVCWLRSFKRTLVFSLHEIYWQHEYPLVMSLSNASHTIILELVPMSTHANQVSGRRGHRRGVAAVLGAAVIGVLVAAVAAPAGATVPKAAKHKSSSAVRGTQPRSRVARPVVHHKTANVCPAPKAGQIRCLAIKQTDAVEPKLMVRNSSDPSTSPSGYSPSDLQSAYNLPSATAGKGQTVAVTEFYDHPTAESDLAVYRAQYGLPACTTANGCFTKVNNQGKRSPLPPSFEAAPPYTEDWQTETGIDLDMVSAICPNCHILLVEAPLTDFSQLSIGISAAVQLGAKFVSNSWAITEDPAYDAWYSYR